MPEKALKRDCVLVEVVVDCNIGVKDDFRKVTAASSASVICCQLFDEFCFLL
jgi:hypothetical protein